MSAKPVITIVDDDESVRTAMGGMVESYGYAVGTFESADKFLKSGTVTDTDCLILDVQMPGKTGLELHGELVSSGHQIPTIFMTAFPDTQVRERAMRAGAICFLAKPFDPAELIGCIESALDREEEAGV